ncbi:P-loop containing nucleoside triphosphate hydrolase protein [Flammula alnicola]|nr:P-loop containing nucleoside triphosphate hydrolase protein [Flammula alnicola]
MERRTARLTKTFASILTGSNVITPRLGPLFLEAIYTQSDPVACISKIIASSAGVSALQTAIRYDLSPKFLNSHASLILQYLQAEELKVINNGYFLNDILTKLVDPPIFWMEFRKAFLKGDLDENATQSFGWLLLQLCMLPTEQAAKYRQDTDMASILHAFLTSTSPKVIAIGSKIQEVLNTSLSQNSTDAAAGATGPGGRHNNDFADFRKISILPTGEELESTEHPFLRPSSVLEDPETEPARVSIHLDNQFRLLREDMIYEMREELQIATGKKKGYHKGIKIKGFVVTDIDFGKEGPKATKWGLVCECKEDFPQLKNLEDAKARKEYLSDKRNFFKHQSLACLVVGKEIVAFPTINRDEERLAKNPPEIVLQFEDAESTQKALYKLKLKSDVFLIQIDTAVFAYEPVLKGLQQANTLPLSSELLLWKKGDLLEEISEQPTAVVQALRMNPQGNLRTILSTANDIKLDTSQARSLLSGLTQKVSLIQGPPGTGKSFIGGLIAKAIHDHTEQTILVVCYTNHALDDILTGLLDIGIPYESMVRLGGKSTTRTEPLMIQKQARSPRSRTEWTVIDELKLQLEKLRRDVERAFNRYSSFESKNDLLEILSYLEIEDPDFFEAFRVPESDDGMVVVGGKGKGVGPDYLINRWSRGWNAGSFKTNVVAATTSDSVTVWNLPLGDRNAHLARWRDALLQEAIEEFCANAEEYNRCQERLARAFSSDMANTLRCKRIVGCTTTAAAKYGEAIRALNPNVLLVEEAGEILESHVLTSLGPETSQMILIGDHKQLRPKVNHYLLTVEKGDGYDLNRSLFERLILKDYPHETLSQQHRMRPEISALIRHLTYPELTDAQKTKNRPNLLGVQDNIVFIHHEHPEDENPQLADRHDMASTSSKQNSFEIGMILKIVKYLAQQGYGTDKLVILTPYLGQLQKLRAVLKEEHDPVLNDLDSFELIRAGLINPAQAKLNKKPIRLATIDNYQGEESDIVIVSLTRSNPKCDIGFMFSPERLNVLLSRARNALIMLGNANTFRNARKGKELWRDLFGLLGDGKHIYQGLPVKCERHPDTKSVLAEVENFDSLCPDGGCVMPCGELLSCRLHLCPSKCHKLSDHSKLKCNEMMASKCASRHPLTWPCNKGPPMICPKCERAKKLVKEQQQQDLKDQQRRDAEQKAHHERMDALNAQIEEEKRRQETERLAVERQNAIKQKEADLASMRASQSTRMPDAHAGSSSSYHSESIQPSNWNQNTPHVIPDAPTPDGADRASTSPSEPVHSPNTPSFLGKMWEAVSSAINTSPIINPEKPSSLPQSTAKPFKQLQKSPSKVEWNRLKNVEGARNDAIDAIMDMTGLEAVKDQVLKIKSKIDTTIRQQSSIKQERFNVVLLGNPGTGKTTVARHYAKFLATVKAIPGDKFVETTGARLAQNGPDAARKLIEEVINAGGGAIFIDEAYQLTSGNNPGGPSVLDFLLAEMENNVGTLVFIMAGYNKEMEKFFEHNPGLKSRVPYHFNFADYKDEELMSMFEGMIKKEFSGRMKVEDGVQGRYGRIVIRRLGRRRGQPGFGNARDLQAVFARIRERQAARLTKERKEGKYPDDFFMTFEDLIGPDPSTAIRESEAWKKLQSLIGLKAVKDSVGSFFNLVGENYRRELLEKEPMEMSLNRVFLGSPGTGKTTVAKLYGQTLADLGLLSNGEVVVKNPADFVGAVLGASEANTKAILANSVGKVLIIDEAYMLYGGGGSDGSSGTGSNQFKTSVIDTIVAEVQNVPGEDRCVLLLGYKDQMIEMFQNVNPGLSRRFKIEDAFNFNDFTDAELLEILNLKLKQQDLDATDPAKKVAIDLLSRMRNRPNFGNAGEVENAITQAKARCVARRANLAPSERTDDIVFGPEDFDPDYDRAAKASANLVKLFDDIVGCEAIIEKLKNYQEVTLACKQRDMDPREFIQMNFVFTGPPGTGKTTVARKIGQVFYDMGILASAEVVECSASDLVGQFVGQTGPKTKKLFEKALGKVLFVDEAYRLSSGHFAQEAIDELVGLLTHPTFKSKLVVILAGYEEDMNRLMSVNTGLSSRFPEQVVFQNMDADRCLKVLRKELQKKKVAIEGLENESSPLYLEMKELIIDLSELKDWGNARDMINLSKEMVGRALKDSSANVEPKLSDSNALDILRKMLQDRQRRSKVPKKTQNIRHLPEQSATPIPPAPPAVATTQTASNPPPPPPKEQAPRVQTPNSPSNRGRVRPSARGPDRNPSRQDGSNGNPQVATQTRQVQRNSPQVPGRDPGVSDAVWQELAAAKRAAADAERRTKDVQKALERKIVAERRREEEQKKKRLDMEKAIAEEREAARKAQLQRERDEARRREQAARAARQRADDELRAKNEAERQRQEREAEAQRKLRNLGVCVAGFQWTKINSDFYRCAGGAHEVHVSQLGL